MKGELVGFLKRSERTRLALGLVIAALLALGGPWKLAVGFFSHPVGGFSHHREVIGFYASGQTGSAGFAYGWNYTSTRYNFYFIDVRRSLEASASGAVAPQPDARSAHTLGTKVRGAYYSCTRNFYSCSYRSFNQNAALSSFNPDPLLRSGTLDTEAGGCHITLEWNEAGDLYRWSTESGSVGEASIHEGAGGTAYRYTRSQATICGTTFTNGWGELIHYLSAGAGAGRFD